MAVHADDGLPDPRHVLPDAADQRAVLLRHGIAGGVGNVDHSGPGVDHGRNHFKQVGGVGAPGVFRAELDVIGELPRHPDGIDRHLQNLPLLFGQRFPIPVVAELAADVDVRSADSRMDARPPALRQRLAACLDVRGHGAGERADRGSLNLPANQLYGLEILGRRIGIARLDHVHFQLRQLPGDDQLLAASQAGSGSLGGCGADSGQSRSWRWREVRRRSPRLPATG